MCFCPSAVTEKEAAGESCHAVFRDPSEKPILLSNPEKFEVGVIDQATGTKTLAFSLTNPTKVLIEIEELPTSCGCFTVELESMIIRPSREVKGILKVDMRREPAFSGSLDLEALGLTKEGKTGFVIRTTAEVRKRSFGN